MWTSVGRVVVAVAEFVAEATATATLVVIVGRAAGWGV